MGQLTDDQVRQAAREWVSREVRDRRRRGALLDQIDVAVVARKGRTVGMVVPALLDEEVDGRDPAAGFRLVLVSEQARLDELIAEAR